MDLWVANTTKQTIRFNYRLPEGTRTLELKIPVGTQARLHPSASGSLSSEDVNSAIEQLERCFGAVKASEVDRTREFIGLCYSVDKAVPSGLIENAIEHNTDVLTEQGQETRKQSAAAVHETLAAAGQNPRDLKMTTIETIEQAERGAQPKVIEKTEVHRPGEAPAQPRGRKGRH